MASKSNTFLAMFLLLNILFCSLASATKCPTPNPNPKPTLKPHPSHKHRGKCPRDTLKFGVCANLLGVGISLGSPLSKPCCSLLDGLVDLEAALCLCTAVKANVLNIINLSVPVDISLILNKCGRTCPKNFKC